MENSILVSVEHAFVYIYFYNRSYTYITVKSQEPIQCYTCEMASDNSTCNEEMVTCSINQQVRAFGTIVK